MNSNRAKLRFHGRWFVTLGLALGVWASTACSSGAGSSASTEAEQSVGSVHLALETRSASPFRLRGAAFEIKDHLGVSRLTLDGDASAEELTAELPQGSYTISLADGWSLQQASDTGDFAEVQAALVTANPREFSVKHGLVTELSYAFATDAGLITLGRGSVSVGVAVVDPAALSACQVLESGSCPSGRTCLLAGETGAAFCAQPGALPVGAACSAEQCVAGAQCLRTAGEATGVCKRFCDPSAGQPFCDCQSLSFDATIGVCAETPACEPNCAGSSFTFTETSGDDVSPTALFDFFSGLQSVSESDFIFFQVDTGDSAGGAWCASHANFYVSNYLAFAPGNGAVSSGNWEKFSRPSGGDWSGPDTAPFTNFFGLSCNSRAFDWCSEWGLGSRFLSILPAATDWESRGNTGITGGAQIKVSVGPSRAAACGF